MSNKRIIKFRAWTYEFSMPKKKMIYNYWPITKERLEDIEIQQFTGLKDKNETEIYEGDIVKVEKPYINNPVRIVEFNQGEYTLISKTKTSWERISTPIVLFTLNVLGNIYENPELLEEKIK